MSEHLLGVPHQRFPCWECGTKHYDGCECDFCVAPYRRAEYERQRLERAKHRTRIREKIARLREELAMLEKLS